jgi:predicted enzyme related to lactoylglutathione lyase
MLDAVSYVWFYVKDLEKSIQFYSQTLGFTIAGKWHEGALFNVGNLLLGVHIEEGGITRGGSPIVTFRVIDDIEKVYEILKTRGAQFTGGISVEPYGKIVPLKDPDGHSLLLHQPSATAQDRTV